MGGSSLIHTVSIEAVEAEGSTSKKVPHLPVQYLSVPRTLLLFTQHLISRASPCGLGFTPAWQSQGSQINSWQLASSSACFPRGRKW